MLLDNKRRNLWTSSAKERRSPELTAAMTLKRVMAKELHFLNMRLLIWVESSWKSLYCSINAVLSRA